MKPRVAIFDFACCEGCQLQIVNLEEEILDLLSLVEPVEWREAMSDQSPTYDIAIVEGSVTRAEDEERLKDIRKRAGVLVALGACATIGGVNKIKNLFPLDEVKRCVYGDKAGMPHLETGAAKALHEVVPVDVMVQGCPIDKAEFGMIVRSLALGKTPVVPQQAVCVECKRNETPCRYDYGEVCLGPVTLAGCGARCPGSRHWCFGCRGPVTDPNLAAAREVMARYKKTEKDLEERRLLFNSR